jgi:hypothetical protein
MSVFMVPVGTHSVHARFNRAKKWISVLEISGNLFCGLTVAVIPESHVRHFIHHHPVFYDGIPVHGLADKPAFLQHPHRRRVI